MADKPTTAAAPPSIRPTAYADKTDLETVKRDLALAMVRIVNLENHIRRIGL